MQVLASPSYREGFPNAPLEAALAGVPTVGFAATGVVNAVEDGTTERVIKLRDTNALATEILQLLEDTTRCNLISQADKNIAMKYFSLQWIWVDWYQFYIDSLTGLSKVMRLTL